MPTASAAHCSKIKAAEGTVLALLQYRHAQQLYSKALTGEGGHAASAKQCECLQQLASATTQQVAQKTCRETVARTRLLNVLSSTKHTCCYCTTYAVMMPLLPGLSSLF